MKKVKALGLAAVMALALTGLLATSAFASFHSELSETKLTATPSGLHVLTLGDDSYSCESASFNGLGTTQTFEDLQVSPELAKCEFPKFIVKQGWNMRGCKFKLHLGPTNPQLGRVSITNCEPSMLFLFTPPGGGNCTMTIGNQESLATIAYKNIGSGSKREIEATASLSEITYTQSGTLCNGSNGTFNNGTYTGVWKIKGTNAGSGTQAGIWVEGEAPTAGFHAEEAPVTIAGNQLKPQSLTVMGGTATCSKVNYKGESASATTESLSLVPTFGECTPAKSVIAMGGCAFSLSKSGLFAIAGATCATEPIKATVNIFGVVCNVEIGPQSGLSKASYENVGSGVTRSITVTFAVKGITYTATSGAGCALYGTFSDGTYSGTATLAATNKAGKSQGLWVE